MRPKNRRDYKVFVASPGDVAAERKILFAVIDELNKSWKNIKYARLECLSWEESVHAAAGKPEEVIKEQIPFETADIFIAILWKRFGTPTSTNHPDDGHPYLSGTQQEIEESYEWWKRTGRPIIMLYRKEHEIPSSISNDELDQLRLINNFLDQFKPSGKYPALIKPFREGEFRELVKRELEQTVQRLVDSGRKAKRERPRNSELSDSGEKKKNPEPATEPTSSAVDPTVTWLRNVKLRENPFLHQDAEHDVSLPIYFTRFPELYAVTTADLTFERKSWFFFGSEGGGKTALRKFIAARGRPQKPDSDLVCIEYDQRKFEHLLNKTDDLNEFQVSFVQSIFEALSTYTGNAIQSSQPPGSLLGNLVNLSVALRAYDINWVLCLIDPGKADFKWKGSQVSTSSLISPLFRLAEVGGYGFRYFLPQSMKDELEPTFSSFPFNYIRVKEIRWDERTLRDMLGRRMTLLSVDQTAPYRSLGELCEDEQNLSTLIDSEIASLAQGNPRGAIWLANHLIEQHCYNYPPLPRIALDTWNNVKHAWWSDGERRILGTSVASIFRVLSDRAYYQNWEIILPERSDRLLKALILARGSFCSKQELIKAGWKGEKNLEGISEKALSEAMRRMKEELKKELKTKGFPNFDGVKSVRGRGYRLLQPGASQPLQEGDYDQ